MTIKLNDPAVAARNAALKAHYGARAAEAVTAEGLTAEPALIDQLANAAWRMDGGDLPGGALAVALNRQWRAGDKRLCAAARRAEKSLSTTVDIIQNSGGTIKWEVVCAIKEAGVSPEDAERTVEAMFTALARLQKPTGGKHKPARPQSARSAWALQMWAPLNAIGCGMRPAARVIAHILDGNSNDADNIYQAIRNAEPR